MMSNTLLESVVKKNRARLIPFMLALYVLAFLDRSNIGFAKETYQLDTGLSNEAYALGAGIFFVVYAFLGVPANLLMRKFGARRWIGCTTLLWGVLSAAMAWADTEAKFRLVRTLLGAAEAGFFPGMIYLTSQWFPQQNRASIMGLFYMGAPLALTLGSPLSGALLEMHGFMGHVISYYIGIAVMSCIPVLFPHRIYILFCFIFIFHTKYMCYKTGLFLLYLPCAIL